MAKDDKESIIFFFITDTGEKIDISGKTEEPFSCMPTTSMHGEPII